MTRQKLYGIIESFQDYKGADATNYGVWSTFEGAKAALNRIIEQNFHYIYENFLQDANNDKAKAKEKWDEWVLSNYNTDFAKEYEGDLEWEYDDGDTVTRYYLEKVYLDEN